MRHWLMKTEPSVFSLDDLRRKGREGWDGVRNYEARNSMRAMRVGDPVLIYHSNAEAIGVAGLAEISREAHPDATAWDPANAHFDPRSTPERPLWDQVEVAFVRAFPQLVSRDDLQRIPAFSASLLWKRSRLSVIPLTDAEFAAVLAVAEGDQRARPERAAAVRIRSSGQGSGRGPSPKRASR